MALRSQNTSMMWSRNSLNPMGMAMHTTFDGYSKNPRLNRYGVLINSNIGSYDGVYTKDEGLTETEVRHDRFIFSVSVTYQVSNPKDKKDILHFYFGPSLYKVTTTELNFNYSEGWMTGGFIRTTCPVIFSSGFILNHGMLTAGLGINTPPIGSNAPIRTNLFIGIRLTQY